MKVVAKFAVAFFLASILCLGVFTYVLANREAARFEGSVAVELNAYGHALVPTLEAAWRDRDYETAARIVGQFEPDGEIRASLEPEGAAAPAPPPSSDGRRLIRMTFPVAGPREQRAVLTLERYVLGGDAIVQAELVDQALAAGALAVTMALLAVLLGAIVIGNPLARIVEQARRIGGGDFSVRLRADGTDEIGALKRELNAMCDRLIDAQSRLEEEATARVETLEKLRHLDRLRTVGTIASGIAHELGTPLNILLLRGQSLAKGEIESGDIADAGASVVNQVEKMSRIVRQLLDFARTGGSAKALTTVDLGAVAQHAVALLSSLARKNGVTIVLDHGEPVNVQGDFGQIEQAVTNLIVNGIQSMPAGGRLDVRVSSADARVLGVIEVRDEGEGMSEEVRARIFEPFFTTKPQAEGTGLGLHVARGIAADHGGSVVLRTTSNQGSTFALQLPRST